MIINNELCRKLYDLTVDYKCLSSYSTLEDMVQNMENNCSTFKEVCNYIRYEDKSFKEAQELVLENLRKNITNIVVDQIYDYV